MLDSVGRWILNQVDYRVAGLLTVLAVVCFVICRLWRYKRWPAMAESLTVAVDVLALFTALAVGVVFLLTEPPAVETLSPQVLVMIGVVTLIAVIGQALPSLVALFKPEVAAGPKRREIPSANDSSGEAKSPGDQS